MLTIKNLSKSYNENIKAIDNINLEIKPGDIYGFIGHNGAGKTTTLKCVTGILDFTEGEIFINGKNIKENSLECKKITAYIPDNPDLYDNMKAISYLNLIADIYEVPKKLREENIKKCADSFKITEKLGDSISSFSHGMKQKVAIISALIHEPKLLILDEPFVGLDPISSFALKTHMKDLCDKGGAIFFSTHVLEVAEILCNKIAIIKDGKILVNGETKQVRGDSSLENLFLELNNVDK